jgi:hypothetical protein
VTLAAITRARVLTKRFNLFCVCFDFLSYKEYTIDPDSPVEAEDKKRQKITLQKVISEKHNDCFLKIDSLAKRAKEMSMNRRFQENFEKGLSMISASPAKTSGVKTEEEVYERHRSPEREISVCRQILQHNLYS